MPERRTAKAGRRSPVRKRPAPKGEAADEELEPDHESADGDRTDEEREPTDEEQEPVDEEPVDEEPEPADERDAPGRRASSVRHRDGGLSAAEAARSGVRGLADLIGKRPEGITAVEPTDDGWCVGMEVVEDRRVPSASDILAIYEAMLDADGTLLSYRRVRRYPRGRGDDGGDR
jgi:hypothetical protein